MKQKDIALIIFIVGIGAIISVIASKAFIAPPKDRKQEVEVVEAIKSDFQTPSEKYFNKDSLDPTQTIQIGGDPNTKPFNGQ